MHLSRCTAITFFYLTAFLLLGSTVRNKPSPRQAPVTAVQDAVQRVARALSRLERNPTPLHYDSLRYAWEQVGWLHPALMAGPLSNRLDNNACWVRDNTAGESYPPEAGALQRLEDSALRERTDSVSLERVGSYLVRLSGVDRALLADRTVVPFLLALELDRQFTLTLGGHYRLDPRKSRADVAAFLDYLATTVRSPHLPPGMSGTIARVADTLARGGFEDRPLRLYRTHFSRWKRRLMAGLNCTALARKFNVAACGDPFDTDYWGTLYPSYADGERKLGNYLFFDPLLSGNRRRSCASCHQRSKAFTDGRARSMAYRFPRRIDRNAPSLYYVTPGRGRSGMDLRRASQGHFIQAVLDDPRELNVSMDTVIARLSGSAEYRSLFGEITGVRQPDSLTVIRSLSAYVLSLSEGRAANLPNGSLAHEGFALFQGKARCGSCHLAPTFSSRQPPYYLDASLYPNATASVPPASVPPASVPPSIRPADYADAGRPVRNLRAPGLRNLGHTAPYGYDGRHRTLPDYLTAHYNYRSLSSDEQLLLIDFLRLLDDTIPTKETYDFELPLLDGSLRPRRPAGVY